MSTKAEVLTETETQIANAATLLINVMECSEITDGSTRFNIAQNAKNSLQNLQGLKAVLEQ